MITRDRGPAPPVITRDRGPSSSGAKPGKGPGPSVAPPSRGPAPVVSRPDRGPAPPRGGVVSRPPTPPMGPGHHPGAGPRPPHHPAPVPRPPHHPAPPPPPISRYVYHRPYSYDPLRYYAGWNPYRPVYPWWLDVARLATDYALGYYIVAGRPVYYYYPTQVVAAPTYVQESIVIVEPVEPVVTPAPVTQAPITAVPITETPIAEEIPSVDDPITEPVPEEVPQGEEISILEDAPEEGGMSLPQVTKEQIDTAWEGIQKGDEAFAKADLALAATRYAKITRDMPALPDAWFRLGYTEMARGNYTKAEDFMLKGMEASRIWPASPFSLDYIYQGATGRKSANLQTLEATALSRPTDSGLNLLAGMAFYSDGQTAKATKYLENAKKFAPEWSEFVDPMLKNNQ